MKQRRQLKYIKQKYEKHWLFTSFIDFAKSQNVNLLDEDLLHISTYLFNMPQNLRKSAMRRYIDEWLLGMQEHSKTPSSQNSGRRKANLWLIEYDYETNKML